MAAVEVSMTNQDLHIRIQNIKNALPKNVKKGLTAVGAIMERHAKRLQGQRPYPMIRTGTFRRSIGFVMEGWHTVKIGPNTVYAASLEFGNPRWKSGVSYPTFRPTFKQKHKDAIEKFFDIAVKQAVRK